MSHVRNLCCRVHLTIPYSIPFPCFTFTLTCSELKWPPLSPEILHTQWTGPAYGFQSMINLTNDSTVAGNLIMAGIEASTSHVGSLA